jgi:nicotinamidase-related amidase
MSFEQCALIFVGYQNDYFAEDGILRPVIEEADQTRQILKNTLKLIEQVKHTPVMMIQTPIIFTPDYSELVKPVGILKTIVDVQAFREGTKGAEQIPQFKQYGKRINTIKGKRGLNAFSNTELHTALQKHNIKHVIMAGAVTSICIDSTGRAAHERGYQVTILDDCTASRTAFEQSFYCDNIFPLYAEVLGFEQFIHRYS